MEAVATCISPCPSSSVMSYCYRLDQEQPYSGKTEAEPTRSDVGLQTPEQQARADRWYKLYGIYAAKSGSPTCLHQPIHASPSRKTSRSLALHERFEHATCMRLLVHKQQIHDALPAPPGPAEPPIRTKFWQGLIGSDVPVPVPLRLLMQDCIHPKIT